MGTAIKASTNESVKLAKRKPVRIPGKDTFLFYHGSARDLAFEYEYDPVEREANIIGVNTPSGENIMPFLNAHDFDFLHLEMSIAMIHD